MGNVIVRNEDDQNQPGQANAMHSRAPHISPNPPPEVAALHLAPVDLCEFDQPVAPQLALRSDGVVLLSTEELTEYDLSTRRRWTGIELTRDEIGEVRRRFAGVAEEAAAHVGGKLTKKKGDNA